MLGGIYRKTWTVSNMHLSANSLKKRIALKYFFTNINVNVKTILTYLSKTKLYTKR